VPFGYDVPLLVNYKHIQNQLSEHKKKRRMPIGANCVIIIYFLKKKSRFAVADNVTLPNYTLSFF
jgi:hypothetical protein